MGSCIMSMLYLIHSITPNNNENTNIAQNICFYSEKRNLDYFNIAALIAHESSFSPRAVSRTSDFGLMQLNKKYIQAKCNPLKVRCNIKIGTKRVAIIKKAGYLNGYHWLRRYNWHSKKHYLRVLWIAEALRKILGGHTYLITFIRLRKYQKINIKYNCIKKNLCSQLKMIDKN